jgi:hypothetical protein
MKGVKASFRNRCRGAPGNQGPGVEPRGNIYMIFERGSFQKGRGRIFHFEIPQGDFPF